MGMCCRKRFFLCCRKWKWVCACMWRRSLILHVQLCGKPCLHEEEESSGAKVPARVQTVDPSSLHTHVMHMRQPAGAACHFAFLQAALLLPKAMTAATLDPPATASPLLTGTCVLFLNCIAFPRTTSTKDVDRWRLERFGKKTAVGFCPSPVGAHEGPVLSPPGGYFAHFLSLRIRVFPAVKLSFGHFRHWSFSFPENRAQGIIHMRGVRTQRCARNLHLLCTQTHATPSAEATMEVSTSRHAWGLPRGVADRPLRARPSR